MMIMELLYNGQIYPSEVIMSQDERFKEAEAKVDELFEDLLTRLDDKDTAQAKTIRETMYESQSYAEEENFRYGLTLGVMLMQEIYEVYGARYFRPN